CWEAMRRAWSCAWVTCDSERWSWPTRSSPSSPSSAAGGGATVLRVGWGGGGRAGAWALSLACGPGNWAMWAAGQPGVARAVVAFGLDAGGEQVDEVLAHPHLAELLVPAGADGYPLHDLAGDGLIPDDAQREDVVTRVGGGASQLLRGGVERRAGTAQGRHHV